MPADGSIIIDTRVNNKGAEADLKLLQAKAKSTAQQISALDKELSKATSQRSKLADDLEQAKNAANETADALARVDAAMDQGKTTIDAQVRAAYPGLSAAAYEDIAASRFQGQYAAQFAESQRLSAQLSAQQATVSRLTAEYDRQASACDRLESRKKELTNQQKQEQAAVDQAAAAYSRLQRQRGKESMIPAERINKASNALTRFGSRLAGIVSGALVFNIISSGLSRLTSWMGNALKSTDAFSQALANLKGAASMAAAPLINTLGNALAGVINLLATGISYLAQFIALLTGQSLTALKQGAQAMNGYGSAASGAADAAKKAAKSLAGFDEIERLDAPQQDTSGGGAGGSGPNYDFVQSTVSGFDKLMDRVKKTLKEIQKLYEPSVRAWQDAWKQIQEAVERVRPRIEAAALDVRDNALKPLADYLWSDWMPTMVNSWSQAFAPIVGGLISTGVEGFATLYETACGIVRDSTNNILLPSLELVKGIWTDMMQSITDAWATWGEPIMQRMQTAYEWLAKIISDFYYTIWEPIQENAISNLQRLWDEALGPLFDDLTNALGLTSVNTLDVWNNSIVPFLDWIINKFGPGFVDVITGISDTWTDWTINTMKGAREAGQKFAELISWFQNSFLPYWKNVWDQVSGAFSAVWGAIVNTAKTNINTMIGLINGMLRAMVSGLNKVFDALNNISIPDWVPVVGGSGFNFSQVTAPQIPYLAQGAVIPPNREFMAVLGDQSHGTNVEAPLATIQQAVAAVMQDYQDGNLAALEQVVAVLRQILEAVYGIHIGDAVIGQAVTRYNSRQAIITGRA